MTHTIPITNSTQLQTRYRLLDAAARDMATRGYDGISMRRIAAEAGISAAGIYKHFPDGKQGLYEAVLQLVAEAVTQFMAAPPDPGQGPAAVILQQCDRFWDFFATYPNVASLVVRENIAGGSHGPSPYLETNVRSIGLLRSYLEQAIAAGHIAPLNISAFLFWVTSYCSNFHGCQALREAVWTDDDLAGAKTDFLAQVQVRLAP